MEEVDVAVKWWSEAIVDPKMDNGDANLATMTIFGMAKNSLEDISEEKMSKFKEYLKINVEEKFKEYGEVILEVDYQPFGVLRRTAEESGIIESHFPVKTIMKINLGKVTVKHGYGSDTEVLYETVEYWTNEIKNLERRRKSFEFYYRQSTEEDEMKLYLRSIERVDEEIEKRKQKIKELS